jgi:hypothetical protein
MNIIERNFRITIENWRSQIRLHKAHHREMRRIKKLGKDLKMRIAEADELNHATKKTYWVKSDYNGKFRVLDNTDIRNLKRAKIMNREVTIFDMLLGADYCTMNNHFIILKEREGHGNKLREWEFFRGTILECTDKYTQVAETSGCTIQILGGFERVVTIKDGKVIKH